jgi:hypothetical protein
MNVRHKPRTNALGIQYNRKLLKHCKSLEAKKCYSSIGRRIVIVHSYYRIEMFEQKNFLMTSLFNDS